MTRLLSQYWAAPALLLFSLNVAAAEVCRTVVEINSDLWVTDAQGATLRQITADGRTKRVAKWSPNGEAIAHDYSPHRGNVSISLRDATTGQALFEIKNHSYIRYIGGITWIEPRILFVDGDVGPHGGYYELWRLAPTLRSARILKRFPIVGGGCAISAHRRYLGCSAENGIDILSTEKRDPTYEEKEEMFYPDDSPYRYRPLAGVDLASEAKTWSPTGLTLAIVGMEYPYQEDQVDGYQIDGERTLFLFKPFKGSWDLTKHPIKGLTEQVVSLRYTPGGQALILETEQRIYRYTLASNVLTTEPGTPKPKNLTVTLGGRTIEAKVLDWFCESDQVPGKGEEEEEDDED